MGRKKTILVVEDDDDSRMALCTILESLGFRPLEFASPMKVMEGISGKRIDLALLDIMMPEMNGYELLQLIRDSEEFKEVPVFMVTAQDNDREVLQGYKYGADYYIMKPYTSKQLLYGLKLYLDND